MICKLSTDIDTLTGCLQPFVKLVGTDRWERRTKQLSDLARTSPYQAKIAIDYHWLELVISHYMASNEAGLGLRGELDPDLMAALLFCQNIVATYHQLPSDAQTRLGGRLQGAINAPTGFAPVYIEMATARLLWDAGYDVQFSDLESLGRYDLMFSKDSIEGEVECKSLSCDAGRKIHRRDFYRFADSIAKLLSVRSNSSAFEAMVFTLQDRLLPSHAYARELGEGARQILQENVPACFRGSSFAIERRVLDPRFAPALKSNDRAAYQICRDEFGESCHVAGPFGTEGGCILVMKSERCDDTSAPLLESLKKAATQFSKSRPAFIAIQYEDIMPEDLLLRHIRRKVGLISYYLFHLPDTVHVAGTYFRAYGGLVPTAQGWGEPGFAIRNPWISIEVNDFKPFLDHIPDDEFAKLLGVPDLYEGISNIPIEGL